MPRSSEPKTADELKIFAEALEKPGLAERKAYLDEICGDNPALRSSVEELLKHHLEGSSFLHQPVVPRVASYNLILLKNPSRNEVSARTGGDQH
jgi:hypothetical protein